MILIKDGVGKYYVQVNGQL